VPPGDGSPLQPGSCLSSPAAARERHCARRTAPD
jgi:hypothetical protein